MKTGICSRQDAKFGVIFPLRPLRLCAIYSDLVAAPPRYENVPFALQLCLG
jgi:hypothetical protein